MTNPLNKIIKVGYVVLMILPLLYLSISTYSYISTVNALGTVPQSHGHTQQLEKSTGKSLKIFPKKVGGLICTIYLMTFWITPVFVITVLLARYFFKSIKIFKRLAITLIVVSVLVIILANQTEFASWYMSYVND
jgi:hypothetical protein